MSTPITPTPEVKTLQVPVTPDIGATPKPDVAPSQPATTPSSSTPTPPQGTTTPPAQPTTPSSSGFGIGLNNVTQANLTLNQDVKQFLLDSDSQRCVSIFSWDAALAVDQTDERNSASRFIYEQTFVSGAVATLKQHRMILLTGETDCGKESMARYLAYRLREDGEIEHDTLIYTPQGPDVRLNLRSTLLREKAMHGRVTIFLDVLELKNPSLRQFLTLLKREAVSNITHDLQQMQSYLIMTAVPSTLPPECAAGLPATLIPAVPELSPDLLFKGIEKHTAHFLAQNPDPELAKNHVPESLMAEIAKRCRTMSRAIRFIDSKLLAVLRSEKSLDQAFAELDSLLPWCRYIAESNYEAWIYVLSLALSDPLNSKEGVPWADFYVIHDAVRRHLLRRKLRDEKPFDEAAIRSLIGVKSSRDPSYVRYMVSFLDPNTAESLWRVLLANFQSLLTGVVPVLLELIEHDSPFVRSRAAQALGRIGGLDAAALSRPLLNRWARSESWMMRTLVGYAAQGVLSSGDLEYRHMLLASLNGYIHNKRQAWSAISAYKQIGATDLALAMEKLKEIAKARLSPAFEASREITQRLENFDRQLVGSKMPEAEMLRLILSYLGDFYNDLFKEDEYIARTFKYTLVSLAMNPGLIPLLPHLTSWAQGAPGMGALVCMVFLQEEGIADELTARTMTLVMNPGSSAEKKHTSCNMVLASLIGDSEQVQTMVRFLQDMYAGLLDFFPPDTAVGLTHLLFDYCKKWVVASLPIPPCRAAMVELVGRLLHSQLADLYERTYDWLTTDPDFAKPEMAAFAKSAKLFDPKKPQ